MRNSTTGHEFEMVIGNPRQKSTFTIRTSQPAECPLSKAWFNSDEERQIPRDFGGFDSLQINGTNYDDKIVIVTCKSKKKCRDQCS